MEEGGEGRVEAGRPINKEKMQRLAEYLEAFWKHWKSGGKKVSVGSISVIWAFFGG